MGRIEYLLALMSPFVKNLATASKLATVIVPFVFSETTMSRNGLRNVSSFTSSMSTA